MTQLTERLLVSPECIRKYAQLWKLTILNGQSANALKKMPFGINENDLEDMGGEDVATGLEDVR